MIDIVLASKLIKEQFPQWANLPIKPVAVSGHDNRTFRLGNQMLVRLPSAEKYAPQVEREHTWLPFLAKHLSIQIPKPLALGKPSYYYPWPWSIYTWIDGESANTVFLSKEQLNLIAFQLAEFLKELHKIPTANAPLPGFHNFYRGAPGSIYDVQTRAALKKLEGVIDTHAALHVWEKAMSSSWHKEFVWIHGDLVESNFLVKNGRLHAIIDFGLMGIGDPACDLVIAWRFFKDESRKIFQETVGLDQETWLRARGWALWKALFELAQMENKEGEKALKEKKIIKEIL